MAWTTDGNGIAHSTDTLTGDAAQKINANFLTISNLFSTLGTTYLPLAGGTLTGNLDATGQVITSDSLTVNFAASIGTTLTVGANADTFGGDFGDILFEDGAAISADGAGNLQIAGTSLNGTSGDWTLKSAGLEAINMFNVGGQVIISTGAGITLDDGSGNLTLPYGASLGLGGNGSGVYLQSYDGYLDINSSNYIQLNVDGYNWNFNYGGSLSFPDGSTQYTAYTGSSTSSLSAVCAVGNTTTTNISLTGSTSSLLLNTGYIGWQNSTSTAIGGSSSAIAFYIGGMFRVSINATGFSGDISQCTGLNAGNIATGTINNARLPSAISVSTISGGYISPIATKTAAYTIATSDSVILCNATSAAFTVTLPAISTAGTGREYTIKKTDSAAHTVTIGTTSSQTIDGSTTFSLTTQYQYVTVTNDGTYWWIIANGTA